MEDKEFVKKTLTSLFNAEDARKVVALASSQKGNYAGMDRLLAGDNFNYWGYESKGSHVLDYYSLVRKLADEYFDECAISMFHLTLLANEFVHGKYDPKTSMEKVNNILGFADPFLKEHESQFIPSDPYSIEGKSNFMHNVIKVYTKLPEDNSRKIVDVFSRDMQKKMELIIK